MGLLMLEFEYLFQPVRKYTFEQPKLKLWIERNCRGKVLNLFAGKTMLNNVDEVRVDINREMRADYYMDALEFVDSWEDKPFNTILLDPPYNLRKAREKYMNKFIGSLTKIKNAIPPILIPGGIVITLGYDSVGMSRKRGFEKTGICLVCHSGDHNDTICLVEKYTQMNLFNGATDAV